MYRINDELTLSCCELNHSSPKLPIKKTLEQELQITILLANNIGSHLQNHDLTVYTNKTYKVNYEKKAPFKTNHTNSNSVVITTSQPLTFTFNILEQQTIKLLKLSINKSWFYSRYQQQDKCYLIEMIFKKNTLNHFSYHHQVNVLTKELYQYLLQKPSGLFDRLTIEQLTIQLLRELLPIEHLDISANTAFKKEITNFINTTSLSQVSLRDISNHLGMSVSSLQRKFKRYYDIPLNEYLRKERLRKAKISLLENQLSIGEIAFNAGYKHVGNFTTAFKQQFKITPAIFKKKYTK